MDLRIVKRLEKIDSRAINGTCLDIPAYNPLDHYLYLSKSSYLHNILLLRHAIKLLSDEFMSNVIDSVNVDLFMMTPSVSSPMGPGSDSEAIPIRFGELKTFLTDSSQFGFEPLIMNGIDKVYCYLPSMRGENPDNRHLNQFFHCEIEIKGDLEAIMKIAEDYIKFLCSGLLLCPRLVKSLSRDFESTLKMLNLVHESNSFERITFDDACELLSKSGHSETVNITNHGKDINSSGESELMKLINTKKPVWLTHFDRDRVPFYQKPDIKNLNKVLNADLLFPAIRETGFQGEILGAGQRQSDVEEMLDSLHRQGISPKPYEWYIDLRRQPNYSTTSGFGLGIERYIAWCLGIDSLVYVIPYPRLKNVLTTP